LGNQTADKEKAVDDWQNIEAPVTEQAIDSDVPVALESQPTSTDADVPATEAPAEDDVPNL